MFTVVYLSILTVFLAMSPAFGAGQQMMRTRVPADSLEEARALKNPIAASPEIIEKGKALYEGKGTCVNCHGVNGHGDGPGAVNMNPPPRVFRSHGFWRHRSEGEIFWVIKHGVAGTAMIPFGGLLSDEEIWTVMIYERSFAGGRGPRGMGPRGRGKGARGRGHHGMMGSEKPQGRSAREGCCQESEISP
jgi:mono/diheme cytochrome c family protein